MSDLEGRQTSQALADVTRDPRWSTDDKHRLAAVVTLAMIASGRSADVSPAAMRVTHAFLTRNGVDLSKGDDEVRAALTQALAANAPPTALSRAAAQVVAQDVARRQVARQRRAAAKINPPNKNQAVQTSSSTKAESLLSVMHGARRQ